MMVEIDINIFFAMKLVYSCRLLLSILGSARYAGTYIAYKKFVSKFVIKSEGFLYLKTRGAFLQNSYRNIKEKRKTLTIELLYMVLRRHKKSGVSQLGTGEKFTIVY